MKLTIADWCNCDGFKLICILNFNILSGEDSITLRTKVADDPHVVIKELCVIVLLLKLT